MKCQTLGDSLHEMSNPIFWNKSENLLSLGLMTCQPLWVILCRLPEKGRKEIVEEMKERGREARGTGMKVKKLKQSPSTLTCYKGSRPCPTVSQSLLDTPVA